MLLGLTEVAAEIQQSEGGHRGRKAVESRTGKRRAETSIDESEFVEGGDDLSADDNQGNIGGEEDDMNVATPEQSDSDATEEEDEESGDFASASSSSHAMRHGVGLKGKSVEAVTGESKKPSEDLEEPPPRRELPFPKPNRQTIEKEHGQVDTHLVSEARDEDSTDDEL